MDWLEMHREARGSTSSPGANGLMRGPKKPQPTTFSCASSRTHASWAAICLSICGGEVDIFS
jgi:hypothetical protein